MVSVQYVTRECDAWVVSVWVTQDILYAAGLIRQLFQGKGQLVIVYNRLLCKVNIEIKRR
jgi:hypothetical protein